MKVLHVGWGFQPFRGGGLIEYAEDLMEIQHNNGYQVNYFCTGRFSLYSNKPTLKKWQSKKGYNVYELWNPPVINGFESGILEPLDSITQNLTEDLFFNIVQQTQPDVVHVQEFIGMPTNILKKLKALNIKTVFTVEDYFYLCPTIKLILPDGNKCRIKGNELGRQCDECCNKALRNTLNFRLHTMYPSLYRSKVLNVLKRLKKRLSKAKNIKNRLTEEKSDNIKANEFNQRRHFNLDAIDKVDQVIAMSNKVAEIFNYYKPLTNMITLNLTLTHVSHIRPVIMPEANFKPINFAVINAFNSVLKGRNVLLNLFNLIEKSGWHNRINFYVMGHLSEDNKGKLSKFSFVNTVGKFNAAHLDTLFDDLNIHVGIVPSVWEEAYGFVGIEFLAKGIPVIGNNIGGIPDYVTNETGWLNNTCDAAGLYSIINEIVDDPHRISIINKNLIANRNKYIKSMDTHFAEMDTIYKKLLTN